MAFMIKRIIDLKGVLYLMLLTVSSQATNLDCNGKTFHCVNSTHFMICVDLGGISTTIDDVVLPCPSPTVCKSTNRFECEFPISSTSSSTVTSTVTTESEVPTVSPLYSTLIPFEQYFDTIRTTTFPESVPPHVTDTEPTLAIEPITRKPDKTSTSITDNVITDLLIANATIVQGNFSVIPRNNNANNTSSKNINLTLTIDNNNLGTEVTAVPLLNIDLKNVTKNVISSLGYQKTTEVTTDIRKIYKTTKEIITEAINSTLPEATIDVTEPPVITNTDFTKNFSYVELNETNYNYSATILDASENKGVTKHHQGITKDAITSEYSVIKNNITPERDNQTLTTKSNIIGKETIAAPSLNYGLKNATQLSDLNYTTPYITINVETINLTASEVTENLKFNNTIAPGAKINMETNTTTIPEVKLNAEDITATAPYTTAKVEAIRNIMSDSTANVDILNFTVPAAANAEGLDAWVPDSMTLFVNTENPDVINITVSGTTDNVKTTNKTIVPYVPILDTDTIKDDSKSVQKKNENRYNNYTGIKAEQKITNNNNFDQTEKQMFIGLPITKSNNNMNNDGRKQLSLPTTNETVVKSELISTKDSVLIITTETTFSITEAPIQKTSTDTSNPITVRKAISGEEPVLERITSSALASEQLQPNAINVIVAENKTIEFSEISMIENTTNNALTSNELLSNVIEPTRVAANDLEIIKSVDFTTIATNSIGITDKLINQETSQTTIYQNLEPTEPAFISEISEIVASLNITNTNTTIPIRHELYLLNETSSYSSITTVVEEVTESQNTIKNNVIENTSSANVDTNTKAINLTKTATKSNVDVQILLGNDSSDNFDTFTNTRTIIPILNTTDTNSFYILLNKTEGIDFIKPLKRLRENSTARLVQREQDYAEKKGSTNDYTSNIIIDTTTAKTIFNKTSTKLELTRTLNKTTTKANVDGESVNKAPKKLPMLHMVMSFNPERSTVLNQENNIIMILKNSTELDITTVSFNNVQSNSTTDIPKLRNKNGGIQINDDVITSTDNAILSDPTTSAIMYHKPNISTNEIHTQSQSVETSTSLPLNATEMNANAMKTHSILNETTFYKLTDQTDVQTETKLNKSVSIQANGNVIANTENTILSYPSPSATTIHYPNISTDHIHVQSQAIETSTSLPSTATETNASAQEYTNNAFIVTTYGTLDETTVNKLPDQTRVQIEAKLNKTVGIQVNGNVTAYTDDTISSDSSPSATTNHNPNISTDHIHIQSQAIETSTSLPSTATETNASAQEYTDNAFTVTTHGTFVETTVNKLPDQTRVQIEAKLNKTVGIQVNGNVTAYTDNTISSDSSPSATTNHNPNISTDHIHIQSQAIETSTSLPSTATETNASAQEYTDNAFTVTTHGTFVETTVNKLPDQTRVQIEAKLKKTVGIQVNGNVTANTENTISSDSSPSKTTNHNPIISTDHIHIQSQAIETSTSLPSTAIERNMSDHNYTDDAFTVTIHGTLVETTVNKLPDQTGIQIEAKLNKTVGIQVNGTVTANTDNTISSDSSPSATTNHNPNISTDHIHIQSQATETSTSLPSTATERNMSDHDYTDDDFTVTTHGTSDETTVNKLPDQTGVQTETKLNKSVGIQANGNVITNTENTILSYLSPSATIKHNPNISTDYIHIQSQAIATSTSLPSTATETTASAKEYTDKAFTVTTHGSLDETTVNKLPDQTGVQIEAKLNKTVGVQVNGNVTENTVNTISSDLLPLATTFYSPNISTDHIHIQSQAIETSTSLPLTATETNASAHKDTVNAFTGRTYGTLDAISTQTNNNLEKFTVNRDFPRTTNENSNETLSLELDSTKRMHGNHNIITAMSDTIVSEQPSKVSIPLSNLKMVSNTESDAEAAMSSLIGYSATNSHIQANDVATNPTLVLHSGANLQSFTETRQVASTDSKSNGNTDNTISDFNSETKTTEVPVTDIYVRVQQSENFFVEKLPIFFIPKINDHESTLSTTTHATMTSIPNIVTVGYIDLSSVANNVQRVLTPASTMSYLVKENKQSDSILPILTTPVAEEQHFNLFLTTERVVATASVHDNTEIKEIPVQTTTNSLTETIETKNNLEDLKFEVSNFTSNREIVLYHKNGTQIDSNLQSSSTENVAVNTNSTSGTIESLTIDTGNIFKESAIAQTTETNTLEPIIGNTSNLVRNTISDTLFSNAQIEVNTISPTSINAETIDDSANSSFRVPTETPEKLRTDDIVIINGHSTNNRSSSENNVLHNITRYLLNSTENTPEPLLSTTYTHNDIDTQSPAFEIVTTAISDNSKVTTETPVVNIIFNDISKTNEYIVKENLTDNSYYVAMKAVNFTGNQESADSVYDTDLYATKLSTPVSITAEVAAKPVAMDKPITELLFGAITSTAFPNEVTTLSLSTNVQNNDIVRTQISKHLVTENFNNEGKRIQVADSIENSPHQKSIDTVASVTEKHFQSTNSVLMTTSEALVPNESVDSSINGKVESHTLETVVTNLDKSTTHIYFDKHSTTKTEPVTNKVATTDNHSITITKINTKKENTTDATKLNKAQPTNTLGKGVNTKKYLYTARVTTVSSPVITVEPAVVVSVSDQQDIKHADVAVNKPISSVSSYYESDFHTKIIKTSDVLVDKKIENESTHTGIILPTPILSKHTVTKEKQEHSKKKENVEMSKKNMSIDVELGSLHDKIASSTDATAIKRENINKMQGDKNTSETLVVKIENNVLNSTNAHNIEPLSPKYTSKFHNGTNTSGYKNGTPTYEPMENSTTSRSDTSNNILQDQNTSIPQERNTTVISNDQSAASGNISQTILTAANDTQTIEFPVSESTTLKTELNKFSCRKKRGRYSDEKDCRKFYICQGNGKVVERACPVNTVFSEINKQCTKNLSHCIRNNQFRCVAEGRFSDFLNDKVYYLCVKNNVSHFIRFKLLCQNGYRLNKTSVQCVLNTELTSTSESSKSVSEQSTFSIKRVEKKENDGRRKFKCEEEGIFPDPSNCRKYFVCTETDNSEYRQKRKKCDSDELFHKDKKKCVDADSYEC